jgi:hypothetical protein
MESTEIARRLEEDSVITLDKDELGAVLDAAELVRQTRTAIAGGIRTLRFEGRILIQERDQRGQHYLRSVASEEQAARFVQTRLDAYERMWDG